MLHFSTCLSGHCFNVCYHILCMIVNDSFVSGLQSWHDLVWYSTASCDLHCSRVTDDLCYSFSNLVDVGDGTA